MKKQTMILINTFIILLLILNTIYVSLKERYESYKTLLRYLSAPLSILILIILYISNNQYYKVLRHLVVFRETYKIKIFRRLKQVANFTLGTFMAFSFIVV